MAVSMDAKKSGLKSQTVVIDLMLQSVDFTTLEMLSDANAA